MMFQLPTVKRTRCAGYDGIWCDLVSITYGKANEFNVMRVWGNAYIPVSITYGKANIILMTAMLVIDSCFNYLR